jgi:glycosyltransferase involved in cell wall biosynthesis
MPFFSVIIPVYNKEKFIHKTLQSVLDQTHSDYELIIINDGSTDNSEKVIASFKDSRISCFSQKNAGVANARNAGLSRAKGEFICFLDADDYWYPTFLESIFYYIKQHPSEKVFCTAIEIEFQNSILKAAYSFKKTGDFERLNYFDASQKETILTSSSVTIHKDAINEIGVFDEKLAITEDTDYWIRLGLKYEIIFIHKILARYCYDSESLSRGNDTIFSDYFFSKYYQLENQNKNLKQFMDLNRFSTVIKYKLNKNKVKARKLQEQIDLHNLSFKRKILIHLPRAVLQLLLQIKLKLATIGLGSSVFK